MTSNQTLILLLTLAGLAATGWALAASFWLKARSAPLLRAVRDASELSDRLRAADAVLARLERLGRSPSVASNPPVRLAPGGGGRLPSSSTRLDPAQEHAPTLIAVPDLNGTSHDHDPEAGNAAARELSSRFGEVWGRADRGESAETIARATGQPLGTVELVLGLRRQARAGGRAR
jgi:hypothetical protein